MAIKWYKALATDELPEGRVMTVTLGNESICMTNHDGKYGALDNRCPHQGGPLGEGSIENGLLRCPWHGWDYCPLTGKPPGNEFDDGVPTYEVEVRDDGVYVAIEELPEHEATVADVMIGTMVEWGVKWCFGMVGHSNLYVADALRRQEAEGKLSYIGIRHEGAASFACSAYGKLTGRPASCLAIAGPGATNLLTGLWDAHVDRAPVIALTGQVSSQFLGRHNFQELPLEKAFGQVADYSQTVLVNSNHTELMSLACKSAIINQSVSHLVFPDEIAGQTSAANPGKPDGRVADQTIRPPESSCQVALTMLRSGKRPVIIVGHGARYEMDTIIGLAEHLNCPVLTTFKAKGQIADDHPLGCGVLGRSGTPIASHFMNESDVLLVFGASFSNHTGITPKKPTIQVDLDPMALARFHAVDCLVNGDVGIVASMLANDLKENNNSINHREEIADRWDIWRTEKESRRADDRGQGVNSASIFHVLSSAVNADAIIAVDVGNNTYSFGRYFECQSQAILMSGYLGSIGFAFPAALGAWAATQESGTPYSNRQVVSVSGDGGFGQYLADFTTAVKYGMNITHVLLHNDELGKISKEQRAGQWDVWQTSLHNPDFSEFANNCGGLGIRVTSVDQLEAACRQTLDHDGPAIVEIMSDAELI